MKFKALDHMSKEEDNPQCMKCGDVPHTSQTLTRNEIFSARIGNTLMVTVVSTTNVSTDMSRCIILTGGEQGCKPG